MNLAIKPAPVRRSIHVAVSPAKAFDFFTSRMGRWWTPGHTLNPATTQADVVVEPRAGGRWYEVGADGSTCQWGKVLAWEPPERLLLAWQIDGTWKYNSDFVTEVELRFTADGAGTRVELEHRNLERYGEAAAATAAMLDGGWLTDLARFGALAEGKPIPEPVKE